MKKIINNKLLIVLILTLILIIIDQFIKFIVIKNNYNGTIIMDNLLSITYVENTGGAFGVAQNNILTFIVTNIIVLGIIIRFIFIQKDRINLQTLIMLILILAGGISNVIDRIFRGFVVDFINLLPITNFPKFNLADMYITMGWIGLAFLFSLYTFKELKSSPRQLGPISK